jgi:carboxylesterase
MAFFRTAQEKKYDKGILLIHGFTGTPDNMRPLQDRFEWEGYKVANLPLKGHGTTPEDMRQANWRDWLSDSMREVENLQRECRKVAVAGLSMGGLIALIIAARMDVDAIVTISTPIRYRYELLAQFSPLIRFSNRIRKWPRASVNGTCMKIGYTAIPEAKLYDLHRLSMMAREQMQKVKCPVLVIQSKKDEVVRVASMDAILSGVSSNVKESILLERSPHTCVTGLESETVTTGAARFVNRVLGAEKAPVKPGLKEYIKRAIRLNY